MVKRTFTDTSPVTHKSFSDRHSTAGIEGLSLCTPQQPADFQGFRIFVGTWNVGGRSPNNSLTLEDFLQVEGSLDIYVLGFHEIVSVNAGNVLVIEDNDPAVRWLALISQALNKPRDQSSKEDSSDSNSSKSESNRSKHKSQHGKDLKSNNSSGLHFFQKPSLKVLSENLLADNMRVKNCNATASPSRRARELRKFIEKIESNSDKDSQRLVK